MREDESGDSEDGEDELPCVLGGEREVLASRMETSQATRELCTVRNLIRLCLAAGRP